MQHFTTGLIVGILGVLSAWFFCRKKIRSQKARENKDVSKLEQLSRLTGQIAHEIKNPLSTIKVNLRLIAEQLTQTGINDRNFAGAIRKINVVEKEADRLEHILDDFLRYVGKTELSVMETDINSLLSDIIDFYSPQAHSHSVTIRQGLSEETIVCKVDGDMLKQAILNLFINAQQAMLGGGDLMIRTERQGANGVIQISDTGSGIEAGKLANIFDSYYSSKAGGSGLGLATVKKIIEMHGGTIGVNSEQGKGTLFTIKLPLIS